MNQWQLTQRVMIAREQLRQRIVARLGAMMRRVPVDAHGVAQIRAQQIYIMPTAVGFGYGVLLFITLLGALNYQNNLGLLFTFAMVSVSLVSMHHTWFNLLGLRLQTHASAPVFCGQMAHFTVQLTANAGRSHVALQLRGADQSVTVTRDAPLMVPLARMTTQRGPLLLNSVEIATRYPLGLFHAWSIVQADAIGMVYPRPSAHAPAPAQLVSIDHHARGDQGIGADDFVGPRPYRPGDSPRHLDWKALARERGLIVKQFGGDQARRVWLDWNQLPAGDVELRVSMLCRQVISASDQQIVYGLRLPGMVIVRGHGDVHRHRCLTALAGFQLPVAQ